MMSPSMSEDTRSVDYAGITTRTPDAAISATYSFEKPRIFYYSGEDTSVSYFEGRPLPLIVSISHFYIFVKIIYL